MSIIKKITLNDRCYPQLLRKIPDPPAAIYYRGKIRAEENGIAIVGSRRCSNYGRQATLTIASELAQAGLTIISGLALGIDTCAHQGALEKNKRTIAVLATGLDDESIYPRQNLKLVYQILENSGCLISEWPAKTPGYKANFPARNRIIAGLALATLVIEARQRSGALITARQAKKQKRKLLALPGSIYSDNSKGSHQLIKEGAELVEGSADILKQLALNNGLGFRPQTVKPSTAQETLVLKALKQGPLFIDEIIKITGLSTARACGLLAIMEIEGKIRNLGANHYSIKH